jgi:hypothetical protein
MASRHQQQVLTQAKARVEQRGGEFAFARALGDDDPVQPEIARPGVALGQVHRQWRAAGRHLGEGDTHASVVEADPRHARRPQIRACVVKTPHALPQDALGDVLVGEVAMDLGVEIVCAHSGLTIAFRVKWYDGASSAV